MRLVLFLLAALYLALVFWTFKDAKRRIADPILVAVAVATAIVFPFVGVIIYMILRPPEYLDDVRERELEIRAMERRLGTTSAARTAAARSSRPTSSARSARPG